ncbi:hypothetical protein [Pseudomonas orientalis]|uniref:hypothetical protein n=1 Tax=Pseudomonas orientalis TaxID=76758 RepID=UPI000F5690E6|nr:hypothetical protein [Pseudomonas orientalis]
MNQIQLVLITAIVMVLTFIIEVWLVYLVYRYTDKAEAFFLNSSFVGSNRSIYFQLGFFGKILRNGFLTTVLIMPNFFCEKGVCELSDIKVFPKGLKRLLVATWGAFVIGATFSFVLGSYQAFIC